MTQEPTGASGPSERAELAAGDRERRAAALKVEANMFAYWLAVAGGRGVLHDCPTLTLTYTGGPVLNRVFGARLESGDVDRCVAAVVARFRERRAAVAWLTGPSTAPADLGDRLVARRFVRQPSWYGMALDLTAPPASTAAAEPGARGPELRIAEVGAGATGDQWLRVLAAGMSLRGALLDAFRNLSGHLNSGADGRWRRFVGFAGSRPVSTATLFGAAGAAGLYLVATVPGARRRGYAGAVTRHALAEARSSGGALSVLQATPEGHGLYRRLGFFECCEIGVHRWSPEHEAPAPQRWVLAARFRLRRLRTAGAWRTSRALRGDRGPGG